MVIPKGKKISIFRGGTELLGNVTLHLEEDIVLNLNSTFEPLVNISASKTLNLVSAYSQALLNIGGSNVSKEFGYQTWTKTDPLGFSFTVGLYMKTDGYTDVMKPAVDLINLCLPSEVEADISDENGNSVRGFGLIPPKPDLYDLINDTNQNLAIQVGKIYINKIIFKKVEPTFSQEIDENGYPIWCVLRVDTETAYSATKQMVSRFLTGR